MPTFHHKYSPVIVISKAQMMKLAFDENYPSEFLYALSNQVSSWGNHLNSKMVLRQNEIPPNKELDIDKLKNFLSVLSPKYCITNNIASPSTANYRYDGVFGLMSNSANSAISKYAKVILEICDWLKEMIADEKSFASRIGGLPVILDDVCSHFNALFTNRDDTSNSHLAEAKTYYHRLKLLQSHFLLNHSSFLAESPDELAVKFKELLLSTMTILSMELRDLNLDQLNQDRDRLAVISNRMNDLITHFLKINQKLTKSPSLTNGINMISEIEDMIESLSNIIKDIDSIGSSFESPLMYAFRAETDKIIQLIMSQFHSSDEYVHNEVWRVQFLKWLYQFAFCLENVERRFKIILQARTYILTWTLKTEQKKPTTPADHSLGYSFEPHIQKILQQIKFKEIAYRDKRSQMGNKFKYSSETINFDQYLLILCEFLIRHLERYLVAAVGSETSNGRNLFYLDFQLYDNHLDLVNEIVLKDLPSDKLGYLRFLKAQYDNLNTKRRDAAFLQTSFKIIYQKYFLIFQSFSANFCFSFLYRFDNKQKIIIDQNAQAGPPNADRAIQAITKDSDIRKAIEYFKPSPKALEGLVLVVNAAKRTFDFVNETINEFFGIEEITQKPTSTALFGQAFHDVNLFKYFGLKDLMTQTSNRLDDLVSNISQIFPDWYNDEMRRLSIRRAICDEDFLTHKGTLEKLRDRIDNLVWNKQIPTVLESNPLDYSSSFDDSRAILSFLLVRLKSFSQSSELHNLILGADPPVNQHLENLISQVETSSRGRERLISELLGRPTYIEDSTQPLKNSVLHFFNHLRPKIRTHFPNRPDRHLFAQQFIFNVARQYDFDGTSNRVIALGIDVNSPYIKRLD